MIQTFQKKPVVVQAIRWTSENTGRVLAFTTGMDGHQAGVLNEEANVITLDTLEGPQDAVIGDWIIRGVIGEYYAMEPLNFENCFDLIETIGTPLE